MAALRNVRHLANRVIISHDALRLRHILKIKRS